MVVNFIFVINFYLYIYGWNENVSAESWFAWKEGDMVFVCFRDWMVAWFYDISWITPQGYT